MTSSFGLGPFICALLYCVNHKGTDTKTAKTPVTLITDISVISLDEWSLDRI